MNSRESPSDLLETARLAAEAAAEVHRQAVRDGGARWTEVKTTSSDFVSDVDVAAQEAALSVIGSRHPSHGIMAEEEGGGVQSSGDSSFIWIVDPLDGTTNFLHGHPFYAASVAVWDAKGPIAGVVHAPAMERVWSAARGKGAFDGNDPIAVSQTEKMSESLIGTGFPFKALHRLDAYLDELGRILKGTAGIRRAGAAAIDLAFVASGVLDGFWEHQLDPWDFGAGILLIKEAGGAVERLEGGPITPTSGTVLAANSPLALADLREIAHGSGPD